MDLVRVSKVIPFTSKSWMPKYFFPQTGPAELYLVQDQNYRRLGLSLNPGWILWTKQRTPPVAVSIKKVPLRSSHAMIHLHVTHYRCFNSSIMENLRKVLAVYGNRTYRDAA